MSKAIIIDTYSEGDTKPQQCRYAKGALDITGWTITFRMRRVDGTMLIRTTPTEIAITDGPGGYFEVTFGANDLIAGDKQQAEIEFNDGAGSIITAKDIFFDIAEELG